MHITVPCMHMQRDKHATAHGFGVDFAQTCHDFGVGFSAKNFGKRFHHIFFD